MTDNGGDLDCVACGHEVKEGQHAGMVKCGHGVIHYNCSYLAMKCDLCDDLLTYDMNQQQDFQFKFFRNDADSEEQDDDNVKSMLRDVKVMLVEQKDMISNITKEQEKLARTIEELRQEMKMKDQKINDLQHEVLQMKLEKLLIGQAQLEEKMKSISRD